MNDLVVLHCTEDGDKSISFTTKEEFLRSAMEDGILTGDKGREKGTVLAAFARPGEKIDLDRFVGYILIEGRVVAPVAIEVQTKFRLE